MTLQRENAFFSCRITYYVSLCIFHDPFQSCRSIGFWFVHVQTELSYRGTSYNRRNGTRTINLPQQRKRHADFPPSSFTQPCWNLSRARRSCGHSTRGYSWTRGDASWCSVRCPSLLFVRTSRQPSATTAYRQLEFNYKHLR